MGKLSTLYDRLERFSLDCRKGLVLVLVLVLRQSSENRSIQFERIPDEFVGYFICLLKLRKSKKHFPQLLLSSCSCGLCNHRAQGLAVHVYSLKYKPLVFHVYHAFGRSMIILLWLLNIGLSPNRFENVTVVYHRKAVIPTKKYLQNMNVVE